MLKAPAGHATSVSGRQVLPPGESRDSMARRPLSVGVVITNYNTWDLALRCLDSVVLQGRDLDAVLVADDASSSPPPRVLPPGIRLEVNPENMGLVKTLNRALASVGTDLVVIFDSDAYPTNEFVGRVRRAFEERPELAVAGFATIDEAGRPTGSFESEPGVASLVLGQRLHALWLRLFGSGGANGICVYTCAMAVRRDVVLELGGFDENFDWLDLDHELCMKVNRSSWKVDRLPEIVAFHRGAGTYQRASQRVLRFYRNRWLLLSKFGKIRYPRLTRGMVIARLAAESAALHVLGWIGRSDHWQDKIEGRRLALRYVVVHYRR